MNKALIFLCLLFFHDSLKSQAIEKNSTLAKDYLYACENCYIDEFRIFKDHRILIIKQGAQQKKMVLMNRENLWVDEMVITGSEQLIASPEKLYLRDYNYPAIVDVHDDSFNIEFMIRTHSALFRDIGGLFSPILLKQGLLGVNWVYETVEEKGFWIWKRNVKNNKMAASYNFLDFEQKLSLAWVSDSHTKKLGSKIDSILFILNDEYNLNNATLRTAITEDQAIKVNRNVIGRYSTYAINADEIYLFDAESQKLFFLKNKEAELKLIREFKLPYDDRGDYSWLYFFDSGDLKHYFVKVIPELDNESDIYEFNRGKLILKRRIGQIPTEIKNNIAYSILRDGKLNKIISEEF